MNKPKTLSKIFLRRAMIFFPIMLFLYYSSLVGTVYAGVKSGEIKRNMIDPVVKKTNDLAASIIQSMQESETRESLKVKVVTPSADKITAIPTKPVTRTNIRIITPTSIPRSSSGTTFDQSLQQQEAWFEQQKAANEKWFEDAKKQNDLWYQQQTQKNQQEAQEWYQQQTEAARAAQQLWLQQHGITQTP